MVAFFSRISDIRFGGMYMTLLNTVRSIGWVIPNTSFLKMVDVLTFSSCSNDVQNSCSTPDLENVRFNYVIYLLNSTLIYSRMCSLFKSLINCKMVFKNIAQIQLQLTFVFNLFQICSLNDGNCETIVDGYYVEVVMCLVIGFIWYAVYKRHLKFFESKDRSHWLLDLN